MKRADGIPIWLLLVLCVGFVWIAYLPAIASPYFSVDDSLLLLQPQFLPPVNWRSVAAILRVGTHVDFYPVRDLSYLLDGLLWPGSPMGARVQQFALFFGSAFLISRILRGFGVGKSLATWICVLWMIHPYHAETLIWISARKDLLAIFFALLATDCFLRGSWILCLASFAASLLSKASFSLLPLAGWAALVLGYRPFRKKEALVILGVASALGFGSGIFQRWFYTHVNDMRLFRPFPELAWTSLAALGRMAGGWVWPRWNAIDLETFGEWTSLNRGFILPGLLIWAVWVIALVYALVRKSKDGVLICAVVMLLYLPVSGIFFPHRCLYSTRFFEPLGVASAIAVGVFASKQRKLDLRVFAAAVIAFFGAFTVYFGGTVWADPLFVRESALAIHPRSISLMSDLYGELVNLEQAKGKSEFLDRRLRELRNRIASRCEGAGTTEPLITNCSAFFRQEYELALRRHDGVSADSYFENFVATESLLSPIPRRVPRMEIERRFREGSVTRGDLRAWKEANPYLPTQEYRILRLVSDCLLREGNPQESARQLVSQRLFVLQDVRVFLHDQMSPELEKKARSCLGL